LPSLTTLSPNHQRIGEIAADMVLSYYTHEKSGQQPPKIIDVGYELIERESTASPVHDR